MQWLFVFLVFPCFKAVLFLLKELLKIAVVGLVETGENPPNLFDELSFSESIAVESDQVDGEE